MSLQLDGLVKSSQQEAVAFRYIVGKRVGVIHVTPSCNNSLRSRKTKFRTEAHRRPVVPRDPMLLLAGVADPRKYGMKWFRIEKTMNRETYHDDSVR